VAATNIAVRYPFTSGAELLTIGDAVGLSIAALVRANEEAWRTPAETDAFLNAVRAAMNACIDRGIVQKGVLPGGLKARRRARALQQSLTGELPGSNPPEVFKWVSLWALAVNEENAAGGRVVTAPTNGAAGVLPAVLRFYETLVAKDASDAARGDGPAPSCSPPRRSVCSTRSVPRSLPPRWTAKAKSVSPVRWPRVRSPRCWGAATRRSRMPPRSAWSIISASPAIRSVVWCRSPVSSPTRWGPIKAINAAYLALRGDGSHVVSLDAVIETMRQTGEDMRSQYKETSLGGLAVNVVEC
jgi:L-serine dehydratase